MSLKASPSSDRQLPQDKTRFLTYVVAAGLPYGAGEDIFHYFFKVGTGLINHFKFRPKESYNSPEIRIQCNTVYYPGGVARGGGCVEDNRDW